uniref:Uncharacterized protein n=1 Tax=Salvator merianae TaxID=96440 RepID=A0A8D0DRA9_SALMN
MTACFQKQEKNKEHFFTLPWNAHFQPLDIWNSVILKGKKNHVEGNNTLSLMKCGKIPPDVYLNPTSCGQLICSLQPDLHDQMRIREGAFAPFLISKWWRGGTSGAMQVQSAGLHPGSDLGVRTLVAFSDTGSNTDPLGSSTDSLGSNTDPLGSSADPLGSSADPLGSSADPLGSSADPLGSNADPLGSNADPLGSNAAPLGSNADPLGSNADPLGSNTATELVRSHSH